MNKISDSKTQQDVINSGKTCYKCDHIFVDPTWPQAFKNDVKKDHLKKDRVKSEHRLEWQCKHCGIYETEAQKQEYKITKTENRKYLNFVLVIANALKLDNTNVNILMGKCENELDKVILDLNYFQATRSAKNDTIRKMCDILKENLG